MTVKRTELEILNKAIEIAETKTMRINELGRIEKDNPSMCAVEERSFKKNDIKGVEKYYQEKMRAEEANIRAEARKEKRIAELLTDIEGFNTQLDLLRWLYKDNSEGTND